MSTSLAELLQNFGIASDDGEEKTASAEALVANDAPADETGASDQERLAALLEGGGHEKTSSHGGTNMSLKDIWESLEARDGSVKEAADNSATETTQEAATEEEAIEKVAAAAAVEELSIEKLAAEYDAAGRIMARGYYDELLKLAAGVEDTHVTPGPIEGGSQSKQESLGDRGTSYQVPANFAGTHGKHEPIITAGSKAVHKDVLKDGKSTGVGSGVTMTPPVVGGFATIMDLAG